MKKPPRLLRLVSCLATIVVAGGCVRATFIPTQGAAYPSKDRHCNIEVFSSAVPDREYEEIGIVEADTELLNTVLLVWVEDMLPKLMEEGCLAGGDALIIQSSSTFSEGIEEWDEIRVQRISTTVIRWKTE